MRELRILVPDAMDGLYHVVSRVVDGRMIFGEEEKKKFREPYTKRKGICRCA